jgi:hypothetical protein
MSKKVEKIPGATIRGTYSTYEDSHQKDLNERLGHVVDLYLEHLAMVELGGWGTMLKINCLNGSVPSIKANNDGSFTVYIEPTGKKKGQATNALALSIAGALK